ncbi:polymerase [Aruac virus]|uniref:RNA-directed RNA polymerase L n=2 Tax=Aruac virus TaxID=1272961 RepID=A0A0D3R1H6_9RHAB|nr:polymerase [Aruac virus]AJR28310.1 polymerase [Aruac virus]
MDSIELDDCAYENDFDESAGFDESWIGGEESGSETFYLNNKDYNLNSPIILDGYQDLIKLSLNLPTETTTGRGELEIQQITGIRRRYVPSKEVRSPNDLFKETYRKIVIPSIKSDRRPWTKLLNHVCEISEETKKICEAYLEKDLPIYKDKMLASINEDILQLGEKFWIFHKLVLALNHSTEDEFSVLAPKLMMLKVPIYNNTVKISYIKESEYGSIYVFENYIYLVDLDLILPRNLVLMLKDIFISRFQNLLSMILDTENLFDKRDLLAMSTLYKTGDNIIASVGNKGFDILKLIEPICSLQFYELSRLRRPLIPEFPSYREHINKTIEELTLIHPGIKSLFFQIESVAKVDLLLIIYGSFRHWGHPYIEYEEGLEALHKQVTMEKEINTQYAESLASDLAFKVLKKTFFEKKKWAVDLTLLNKKDKLYDHISKNTWPTYSQIQSYGDNWHKLPLIQCFDIPDLIDPSIIYSDKAHSLQRQEIIDHLQSNRKGVIPTKRVLTTMLETPATDWKEFFQMVNDNGLPEESLIIGLKAKEREMKRIGRFFSLMSWQLREYFVSTEYLIKEHFVPLFKGLTMADGLMKVTKKMLESSLGQGNEDYNTISIANHIDYEKWNNHQRYESNHPVFKVMGQFLGYPNLISRTHEFFQKSWIYYAGRADKIWTDGRSLRNVGSGRYTWNGQAGGLEGLRQKGWSILNYLVIEREAKLRNTMVKVLAQGDNQTITTTYKIRPTRTQDELLSAINDICKNNQAILDAIILGTTKLGLIINKNETVQAADYMNYGKVPIYWGVIRGLNGKRWSRANFVTNDQLPSLANVLSSVSTNALTVSHFSRTPTTSIFIYNFIGTIGLEILNYHNPAIRNSPCKVLRDGHLIQTPEFRAIALFLDPSLGGISGTNLNRFLIRMFPDPVTESLTFWKKVYHNCTLEWIKNLSCACGYPDIKDLETTDLDKLIEDPTGLNIKHGINVTNIIKEEIKKQLIYNADRINNEIMRQCAIYLSNEEEQILSWIRSINPLFPRFVSELYSATFLGTVKSMLGLFVNSRTIRNTYRRKYRSDLDKLIVKSEIIALSSIVLITKRSKTGSSHMWSCSSSHADLLRNNSWGVNIVGMTVPHPCEFLSKPIDKRFCGLDLASGLGKDYITVLYPRGLPKLPCKGPYVPYLGSNTSEGTSILTPWERETNIPLIKRATRLRNAISWFITPDSPLARSILNNLRSLTGLDWSEQIKGFKRTGSAIHRFSSSRVSNGGFSASSPWALSWVISTTDTLSQLNDNNYDFMFQSMLIWAQIQTIMECDGVLESGIHHLHISCEACIRPIEEITLETPYEYTFKDVSTIIKRWIPGGLKNSITDIPMVQVNTGDWSLVSDEDKSSFIGIGVGFVFSDMCLSDNWHMNDTSLYPISLRNRLHPSSFFRGLTIGILRGASISLINRRNLLKGIRSDQMLWGTANYVIEVLSEQEQFLTMMNLSYLYQELIRYPHKIPCSYPPSLSDCGIIFRGYMRQLLLNISRTNLSNNDSITWIFSDLQSPKIMYPFILSVTACRIIMRGCLTKQTKDRIRDLQGRYITIINSESDAGGLILSYLEESEVYMCSSEIRHAAKDINLRRELMVRPPLVWGKELCTSISRSPIFYETNSKNTDPAPRCQNPLISSMRLVQLSTGAHYKIRSILQNYPIKYQDFLCGGDGSGGMTSALLRWNPFSKGIFNSLLELEDHGMKGARPPPPSAVLELGDDGERCVNLYTAWEEPSDLKEESTWQNFIKLKNEYKLTIDLIVLDMEVRSLEMSRSIEENVIKYIPQLMKKGVLIYKTYVDRIRQPGSPIVDTSSVLFYLTSLVTTEVTSSQSSEIYLIGHFDQSQCQSKKEPVGYYRTIDELKKISPVFQPLSVEFQRALRLKNKNFEMGVPKQLIISPQEELIGLFVSLGCQNGYAMHLLKNLSSYQDYSSTTFIFSLLSLTLNSLFNFTDSKFDALSLPSDKSCKRAGIMWAGFLNWVSLCREDIKYHQSSQGLLHGGMFISKRKKPSSSALICLGSGRPIKTVGQTKYFYLDDSIGEIGSITRALIRGFGFKGEKIRQDLYNMIISDYNKGLIWKKLETKIQFPQQSYL